jgi:Type II restriction endonuclease, TdeIII
MDKIVREEIKNTLLDFFQKKLANFKIKDDKSPFLKSALGQDYIYIHSFVHSWSTSFGTEVFEPIALIIVDKINLNFFNAKLQKKFEEKQINIKADTIINQIINSYHTSDNIKPNYILENQIILDTLNNKNEAAKRESKTTQVDLYFEDTNNIFCFDIKTAKPNKGNWKEFKNTLLNWNILLANNPNNKRVQSVIGIPFNPQYPRPYAQSGYKNYLDPQYEIKVGKDFWNFLAGYEIYDELLEIFEEVGKEFREDIIKYFKDKFNVSIG